MNLLATNPELRHSLKLGSYYCDYVKFFFPFPRRWPLKIEGQGLFLWCDRIGSRTSTKWGAFEVRSRSGMPHVLIIELFCACFVS